MLTFYDAASVAASPHSVFDPPLRQLLSEAVRHWAAAGLLNATHLLIVQPGDSEEDIISEIGFSPLVNPYDGACFGSTAFKPFWDDLRDRNGWFELTMTVGNSGFAYVLIIQDADGVHPKLRSLCRAYTGGQAPCTGF